MELIIWMSIAGFINVVLLKYKAERAQWASFALDISVMGIMAWLFLGTLTGMSIALTMSAMFSLYLIFFPPLFLNGFDMGDTLKDLNVK